MSFDAAHQISTPLGDRTIHRLDALKDIGDIATVPYSVRVLLESVLRNHDGHTVTADDVTALAGYNAQKVPETRFPSNRAESSCRTSLACRQSLTSLRCGRQSSE